MKLTQVDLSEEDVSQVYCVSRDELRSVFHHGLSTKFTTMVRPHLLVIDIIVIQFAIILA